MIKCILITYPVDPHAHCSTQSMKTYYNLSREPEDDSEFWNVNILESEGSHDIIAPKILIDSMS